MLFIRYLIFLFFLGCNLALAQSTQTVQSVCGAPQLFEFSSSDVSIAYLNNIFGGIPRILCTGADNMLMQQVFTIYNLGVLVIVGVILIYGTVVVVMQTSQQGAQMGKKISPFAALRVVFGASLLVPMANTGYSAIQAFTMWMITQGIAFADQLWIAALENYEASGGLYSSTVQSDTFYSAASVPIMCPGSSGSTDCQVTSANGDTNIVFSLDRLTAATICTQAWYQQDLQDDPSTSSGNYGMFMDSTCNSGANGSFRGVCFGKRGSDSTATNYQSDIQRCGVAFAPMEPGTTNSCSQDSSNSDCATNYLAIQDVYNNISSFVRTTFQTAMSNFEMNNSQNDVANFLACVSGTFGTTPTESCAQSITYGNISTIYLTDLGNQIYDDSSSSSNISNDCSTLIDEAKQAGWVMAGRYYTGLASCSNDSSSTSAQGSTESSTTVNTDNVKAAMFLSDRPTSSPAISCDSNLYASDGPLSSSSGSPQQVYNAYMYGSYSSADGWSFNTASSSCFGMLSTYYTGSSTADQETYGNAYLASLVPDSNVDEDFPQCPASVETSLDNAIYNLSQYWLEQNANSDAYSNWALTGSASYSIWAQGLDSSFDPAETYNTSVPQQNLFMLLNYTASQLTGLKYFKDEKQTTFYDGGLSGNIRSGDWSDACANGATGCWVNACQNNLIHTPHGIFGMINANLIGQIVDPVAQLKYMGINIMSWGVTYFDQTIGQTIQSTINIAGLYAGVQIALAAVMTAVVGVSAASPAPSVPLAVGQIANFLLSTYGSIAQIYLTIDNTHLNLFNGLASSVAVIYTMLGFYLGVYVSNIAAIIWVFAVIGYFILVIEAMVAAPIAAMGLASVEGHDLLGSATPSVLLLFAIFIRPAGMILGLIFGIAILIPAFNLVNFVFIAILGDLFNFFSQQGFKAGSVVALMGAVGVLLLYAYLAMTVVNACFSMIFSLMDKLPKWIGGSPEQSGIAQQVSEVKQQAGGAGEKAAQGGAQATGTAGRQVSGGQVSAASGWKGGEKEKSSGVTGDESGGGDGGEGSKGTGGEGSNATNEMTDQNTYDPNSTGGDSGGDGDKT